MSVCGAICVSKMQKRATLRFWQRPTSCTPAAMPNQRNNGQSDALTATAMEVGDARIVSRRWQGFQPKGLSAQTLQK
jgi:hypothetical protein